MTQFFPVYHSSVFLKYTYSGRRLGKGRVCVCVCGGVLSGQTARHSLTPYHAPLLSLLVGPDVQFGPISQTSTLLVAIFFQGVMFFPSTSIP